MGSHYIPVGKIKIDKEILDIVCPAAGYDETPPPPEIYCPINGYIPDPTKYVEDPEIEQIIEPGVGEISILVGNPFMQDKVRFRCTVTNSGKYNVFLYGAGNTLLSTTLMNNNAYYDAFLPESGGIQNDGYQTFNLVIAPEIAGNHLTTFRIYKDTNFPNTKYIATYINAPGLTSLADAFYQIPNLKVVEFLGDYNLLTNMHGCFEQAPDLLKVSMPGAFPLLDDISYCFSSTPLLQELDLPSYLPSVTTMSNAFGNSGIGEVHLPESMPSLISVNSLFYGSKRLKSVTLPVSAPNVTDYTSIFRDCEVLENAFNFPIPDALGIISMKYTASKAYKLKGNFVFPEYPNCNNIEYVFENATSVKSIVFTGAMNLVTRFYFSFQNCTSLETLVLPESMTGIGPISSNLGANQSFTNLPSLKTFTLPKYLQNTLEWTGTNSNFLFSFTGAIKLESLSKIESMHTSVVAYCNWDFLWNLVTFDQPNAKLYAINFTPKGSSPTKRGKLESVNVDFSFVTGFDTRNQNLPETEVQRILNALIKLPNSPNASYVYLEGNPGSANSNSFGSSTSAYIPLSEDPNFSVGANVQSPQINLKQDVILSSSGNIITHVDANFTEFPLNNGDKVIFSYLNNVTGIDVNTLYYVINADPLNFTFQISESLGGTVKTFTGDDVNESHINFECHVTQIDGRQIHIDRPRPTNTYQTGIITELDIWSAHFNGWSIRV